MKIAILISSLNGGGAERVAINLNRYFLQHMKGQVDCDLIALNKTGDYVIDEDVIFINTHYSQNPLRKALYHYYLYAHKLSHLKKVKQYNAVISFTLLPNVVNIRSKAKAKTVISVRNYASLIHSDDEQQKLRKTYPNADKIIAVSEQCKNDLILVFKLDPGKIEVINNPFYFESINQDGLKPVPEQDMYLFEGGNTVISVGRFSDQKAFWRLIKAASLVKKDIPGFKLILIGKEEKSSSNQHLLETLVETFDLKETVHFIGFRVNPFAYVKKSQAFVLCSKYEGFPNAMTEALCLGVPVISLDCLSGPREILAPELDLISPIMNPLKATYGILLPQYPKNEPIRDIIENDQMLAGEISALLMNQRLQDHYQKMGRLRGQDYEASIIAHKWFSQLQKLIE